MLMPEPCGFAGCSECGDTADTLVVETPVSDGVPGSGDTPMPCAMPVSPRVLTADRPPREPIMQFFSWSEMVGVAADIGRRYSELAEYVHAELNRNPERTVALRELLNSRTAALRAFNYQEPLK